MTNLVCDYWGDQVKEGKMGGAWSTHGGYKECIQNLGLKT